MKLVVAAALAAASLASTTSAATNSTPATRKVQAIIRYVFGPYGSQAVTVAGCETGGTYWPGSHNGQYLGLFQMGEHARRLYGHSRTAWGQTISAYKYFLDSGKNWGPWSCKP